MEHFATCAAPLHKLVAVLQGSIKKPGVMKVEDKWNEECENAFNTLKEKLMTSPVLVQYMQILIIHFF